MKKIGSLLSSIYLVVILVFIVASITLRLTHQESYFGFQLRVVMSGSMAPKIPVNSLVLIKEQKDQTVSVGDVVTLEVAGEYVTHRIVDVGQDSQGIVYETKGDTNDYPDREQRRREEIVGKVIFVVPYLGKFFLLLGTSRGFTAFILCLVLLILLRYFITLLSKKTESTQFENKEMRKNNEEEST